MISMKTILWVGMRGDEGLKKVREKREKLYIIYLSA
jgi:hypothetical protein